MKKTFEIVIVLIMISLLNCGRNRGMISIIHIKTLDYADTLHSSYFLVRNFIDNKKNEEYIDSFVSTKKNVSFEKNNYNSIHFYFYKVSSITNISHLNADPGILDRYSQQHDLIYWYSWQNGKFFGKFKFKNGQIINPKIENIRIEDVPKK